MHPEAWDFVRRATASQRPRRVVELGSREMAGGSIRGLFPDALAYTGVDLLPGPSVDVVADASEWRPPPGEEAPDLVLCCEVLEHTPRGWAILHNAYAMLAPGGRVVVTAAAPPRAEHSAIDGGPLHPGEYYRNVDPALLATWLEPFRPETLEYHPHRGDVYAAGRK